MRWNAMMIVDRYKTRLQAQQSNGAADFTPDTPCMTSLGAHL